jgi:hypothetical protein
MTRQPQVLGVDDGATFVGINHGTSPRRLRPSCLIGGLSVMGHDSATAQHVCQLARQLLRELGTAMKGGGRVVQQRDSGVPRPLHNDETLYGVHGRIQPGRSGRGHADGGAEQHGV